MPLFKKKKLYAEIINLSKEQIDSLWFRSGMDHQHFYVRIKLIIGMKYEVERILEGGEIMLKKFNHGWNLIFDPTQLILFKM